MGYSIFAIIVTVIWGGAFASMIAMDLHGKKGKNQSLAEEIDTSDMVKPSEESTFVEEDESVKRQIYGNKEEGDAGGDQEEQAEATDRQSDVTDAVLSSPETSDPSEDTDTAVSDYDRMKAAQSECPPVQQEFQCGFSSDEALSLFESKKYKKNNIIVYNDI